MKIFIFRNKKITRTEDRKKTNHARALSIHYSISLIAVVGRVGDWWGRPVCYMLFVVCINFGWVGTTALRVCHYIGSTGKVFDLLVMLL
jgi:hypothetical protein